ncbi:Vacuolar Transporter Chaperone Complex Subunit [Pleurotus pulmonarius]
MKFGRKISNDLYSEWQPFYIDYNLLKQELKNKTSNHDWTDQDEKEFRAMLARELDKVHEFQKEKTSELSHRIRDAEEQVKTLVETDHLGSPIANQPKHVPEVYVGKLPRPPTAAGDQHHETHAIGKRVRVAEEPIASTSNGIDAESQGASRPMYTQDDGSDGEDEAEHDTEFTDGSDESDSDSELGGMDTDTDDSYDSLEARFHALEDEVATLVADVHDLALFTKLNITGFMKILKKHDKQTPVPLKSTFINTYLAERPFYKYNWDALIVKLSHLYDLVRTRGHPVEGDAMAGAGQSAFVRQTTKYWVHPDNLVPLKLAILRNLPVLVFDPNKEFEPKDAAITSIYFDNEDLELYLGRLEKTEGAEAIRLRWYGDVGVKTIFVERKTHREDWTGEKSVKARFPLKEHLINDFLRGDYTVEQLKEEWQALVAKGKKTQAEVDSMVQLASEVQYRVVTRGLKPVMRTFYNRTAFQLPGDARVRISLDTELTMVREDNWDGAVRSGDNWRRTDIGIDWPFDQVVETDKELFKYGVLEVKLQTQFGQEPPKWVTDLVQSHLVEAVPKFSKFIHGCSTLLPHRVDLVPFWLPQMDTDILKPNTGYLSVIERPSHISSGSGSKGTSSRTSVESQTPQYTEPLSEGEEDEEIDLAPARDEHLRTGLSGKEVEEAIAYREQMLKERRQSHGEEAGAKKSNGGLGVSEEVEESDGEGGDERTPFLKARRTSVSAPKPRALSIDPLAPSSAFDETLKDRLRMAHPNNGRPRELHTADEDEEDEGVPIGEDRLLERRWKAPKGKRIAVPVRIEPKVYFAAERTFLKWINISVFIGTIATTLLNFVQPDDPRGLISAGVFTLAALIAIAYAGGVFVYRAIRLRQRRAEGLYYDKYGPSLLCFVMFAAMATNVALRLPEL